MAMSEPTLLSVKEMKLEIRNFYAQIHVAKAHRPKAIQLVREMARKCRSGAILEGWEALSKLEHGKGEFFKNKPRKNPYISGTNIKVSFRTLLLVKQHGRCCYCRRWLVNSAHAKPIDHIIPKHSYPKFALHFFNLAVSCADCNSEKSGSLWGPPPTGLQYPKPSEFLDTFHPRFHIYNEHIRFVRMETNQGALAIYRGLTKQGIQLCNDLLGVVAAKETYFAHNPAILEPLAVLQEFINGRREHEVDCLLDFQNLFKTAATKSLSL